MLLPLVMLALNTGMRQGELLKLKCENADLERGSITIIQGKTLRRETIAIDDSAREALNFKRTAMATFSLCGLGVIQSARSPSTMLLKRPVVRQESLISAFMT